MIPINLKLKRKVHKDVAYVQDLIVEELYNYFPHAVIHGGTAIWRCYNGNRFSEDIDAYIEKDNDKIENFFKSLEKKGFQIIKKRVKANSLYSSLRFNDIAVQFEALFKKIKNFILKEYENSDGIFINVYTLSSEDLINEKAETYLKRKKIRDLYDIFFLLNYVSDKSKIILPLKRLIKNFSKPEDEENLKAIIIIGAIPGSKDIMDYITRWAK
ncbi:MAG: nucleotidyl transferase AbiEii/AbiGii toxin family protein [Nanoarchaeota archaeon]